MVVTTKASRVKPNSGRNSLIFQANRNSPKAREAAAGQTKLRFKLSQEARRQAMMGPTPIKKTKKRNNGTVTVLKYGAPTLTCAPATASEIKGKIVPRKIVNSADTRTILLSRNADSRLTMESSSGCSFKRSAR